MSVANATAAPYVEAQDFSGGKPSKLADDDILVTEKPVAPDQFDPRFETTRWEIWA
ncbi:hypothetical protein EMMF5_000954 [Cystobasidiomycetes sp. EMM_F5]